MIFFKSFCFILRDVKNQQESVQRLSQPFRRSYISPNEFLSEIRPSFWRYATAKSIEDLIRALRKKRRGRRTFKFEDYFYNKAHNEEEAEKVTDQEVSSLYINFFGSKYKAIQRSPRTVDMQKVRPLGSRRVESVLQKLSSALPISTTSSVTSRSSEKYNLLRQCYDTASFVLRKVDEAIEEQKDLIIKKKMGAERILNDKNSQLKEIEAKRILKKEEIKRLQALVKEEEIANIVNMKKNRVSDLILSPKYIPGSEEKYIQELKAKLERSQKRYKSLELSRYEEKKLIDRLVASKKKDHNKLAELCQTISISPKFSSN